MGGHDFYGKQVMRAATGLMFVDSGPIVVTDYGASGARIDGCIDGKVAVEIESRTVPQLEQDAAIVRSVLAEWGLLEQGPLSRKAGRSQ